MSQRSMFLDNSYDGICGLKAWLFFVIVMSVVAIILVFLFLYLDTLPNHEGYRALDCETMREVLIADPSHEHHIEIFAEACL